MSPADWAVARKQLDSRVTAALKRYRHECGLTKGDFGRAHNELAKLQVGHDPDYSVPGMAAAYALKYLPRSVTTLLGAFALCDWSKPPGNILDIGSGTDATALAFWLRFGSRPARMTLVEPVQEMVALGSRLGMPDAFRIERTTHGWEDLISARFESESVDLLVLSNCFSYRDIAALRGCWHELCRSLGLLTKAPARIIVVEPEAKSNVVDLLERGFSDTGWYDVRRFGNDALPKALTVVKELPELSRLRREWAKQIPADVLNTDGKAFLGKPYPVETWNPYASQNILICSEDSELYTFR